MRISQIVEDLSEKGCEDFFSESVTSLSFDKSTMTSVSSILKSFSSSFLESAGFKVETSILEEDSRVIIENLISTKNGIELGRFVHSIDDSYNRTSVHIVTESSGIDSEKLISEMRVKGNRLVKRFLESN